MASADLSVNQILAPLLLLVLILSACGHQTPELQQDRPTEILLADTTHVDATVFREGTFAKQILSQGKIIAEQLVDVPLPPEAVIIQEISVKTGRHVSKGSLIATLDASDLEHQREALILELQQKQLQVDSRLISLGYPATDTSSVPQDLLQNIHLELGIPLLRHQIEHLEQQIASYQIKAPISGLVTEVEAKAHNLTTRFDKLCTLIDPRSLKADFPLLEAELTLVRLGQPLKVTPIYDATHTVMGKVAAMQPQVNEHGLITCLASLSSSRGLMEGMKVRVIIEENLTGQQQLPKSAVVDRQNRFVCFVYRQGLAHWVYVEIMDENEDYYLIESKDLNLGDTIITSHNFDLAHLEPVVLDALMP